MVTAPDVIMFAIGVVLIGLCILMVFVTQKKENVQQRGYSEYIQDVHRAHDTNLKGIELIEETNRLLRELIKQVQHRESGSRVLAPSPRPSPPSDAGIEINSVRGGEGET